MLDNGLKVFVLDQQIVIRDRMIARESESMLIDFDCDHRSDESGLSTSRIEARFLELNKDFLLKWIYFPLVVFCSRLSYIDI